MWKIAKKDLKIFFDDKKALFLALLLPIGLITLFAFAFGGVTADDEEPSPLTVLYVDEDKSATSMQLLAELDSIPGIELKSSTQDDAQKAIRKGDEIAVLLFYKGLEDSLHAGNNVPAELQYDKSRAMEISILQNLIISRLSEIKGKKDAEQGTHALVHTMLPELSAAERDSVAKNKIAMRNSAKPSDTALLKSTSLVGDEVANWGLIQAVAGTAIMMLLFSVSAIGQSMLEEKENGVLKKLLQSPIKSYEIMVGKMLAATTVSLFQLIIMFLFSWVAFGLNIFINLPALLLMMVVTALACSAFGVLLSSIVQTKKQADSLGTIIILFMSGIGGSMIPIYIMPQFMQKAAVVTVNYWSIQGFYDIFWRQTGIAAVSDNVIILLTITASIILVSNYFFRKNVIKLT
jgi:ABC-type Na+ efflux pump permease subunit